MLNHTITFCYWLCARSLVAVGPFIGSARRCTAAAVALVAWAGCKLWWLIVLPHAVIIDLLCDRVRAVSALPNIVRYLVDKNRFVLAISATTCSCVLLGCCATIDMIDGGVCVCGPQAFKRVRGWLDVVCDVCATRRLTVEVVMFMLNVLRVCAVMCWNHPRFILVACAILPVFR
jgi:hypothetical protein